ncbi:alpha/beta fold hydrolase [Hoyosella altamirensis]|uniref:Pimeloyl-ACP methyl ester carboxylesterase n=1 Tax=Hoyosella altamirensis TaxID=616997 RepID=A0A839RQ18_9ACTN|nr:alpha/beta hydrolase [Hoyosella altamirensis]MBB3038063.1 pimeloyl-ACP methyl ester carboxylesterase [Hoyosella altamirensis]
MSQVHAAASSAKVRRREGHVVVGGVRLGITEFGSGGRLVILAPSLLMSRRMQEPMARVLAEKGFHVVCMNSVLSSGRRKADPEQYSSEALGKRMVALLDAMGGEVAVFGGTSLGANAALEAALREPNRTVAVIAESPMLDKSSVKLAPLLLLAHELFTVGRPVLWGARRLAGFLPAHSLATRLLWDFLATPADEHAALVKGLFMGRVAPPRNRRRSISVPAMVIGPERAFLHSRFDALQLAREIPDAHLQPVPSSWSLRTRPQAVAPAIVSFLTEAFAAPWVIARTAYTPNIGDSHLN